MSCISNEHDHNWVKSKPFVKSCYKDEYGNEQSITIWQEDKLIMKDLEYIWEYVCSTHDLILL